MPEDAAHVLYFASYRLFVAEQGVTVLLVRRKMHERHWIVEMASVGHARLQVVLGSALNGVL